MIKYGLYRRLWEQGVKNPVPIDFAKTPHALFIGSSGTGKSYALRLMIGKIALHEAGSRVWLCDFKGDDDFAFLNGCARYYQYAEVGNGLDEFYRVFEARQSGEDKSRTPMFFVFDEYAAYINFLDKKPAEEVKRKLSILLMMGRSFRCHCIFAVQRGDAEIFAKARDNFSLIIAMGNISKESALMFGFDREQMIPVTSIGGGHILFNGTEMTAIQVPAVESPRKLNASIKAVAERAL